MEEATPTTVNRQQSTDNGGDYAGDGLQTTVNGKAALTTDNGQWSLTRESIIINLLNLFIMLKYSLIECIDPITNEVMSFECITPVSPEEMLDISAETVEEVFYVDSLYNLLNGSE